MLHKESVSSLTEADAQSDTGDDLYLRLQSALETGRRRANREKIGLHVERGESGKGSR
jgi:hypothetical protein